MGKPDDYKELLQNHTNIEWVKKAGLVLLEHATKEKKCKFFLEGYYCNVKVY